MADTAIDAANRHKRGGLYFEGFVVGSLTEHRYTRTVTQMDNMLFSNMTLNRSRCTSTGTFLRDRNRMGPAADDSLFTLGLMIGIQVSDMTVAPPSPTSACKTSKFGHPLFEGDTVHCTTEVIGKRESKSRPGARHRRIPPPRLQPGQTSWSPNAAGRLYQDAAEVGSKHQSGPGAPTMRATLLTAFGLLLALTTMAARRIIRPERCG